MKRFDQDVNAPGIAFKKATRETPDHAGNLIILLVFAFGFGLVVFIAWLLLAWAAESPARSAGAAGGLGMLAGLVLALLIIWKQDVMWAIETILGQDFDGDGFQGAPPQMSLEVQHNERQTSFMNLPGPPNAIIAWSRAAISEHSLAYENWEPLFGSYTTPMGKKIELYRAFRQVCVGRGYLIEQGTHSCTLTEDGKDIFRDLAIKTIDDATPLLEG